MTARVDPTFKVPVSLESELSYFSQYHSIVSRSIWDPLAPGISGGAIDLAGRAVIIATALLACYLIMALFSRWFWGNTPPPSKGPSTIDPTMEQYKENLKRLSEARRVSQKRFEHLCGPKDLSDICNGPHSHYQSIDQVFSLDKEKILQLCDVENLKDEECIYTGDLTVEKEQIQLLMKDSKTGQLMDYISSKKGSMQYALGAFFVVLGIKPALAIESKPDKELSSILTELTHAHRNLRLKNEASIAYFINETPFSSFDPRYYLNLSSEVSLTEAVALCFSEQGNRESDQFLSYLLGFGPSWETYAANTGYFYQEKGSIGCMFNKNHYYEIGKVLNQFLFNKDEDRSEIEKLGFTFHSQLGSLIKKYQRREQFLAKQEIAPKTMLSITGTQQILDGLTARTDYFKKSYTLKKWVMETYFSQLLSSYYS